ncbi:MAG: hypothetical protein ABMA64_16470 [Myxococcota bacterium]
MFDAIGGRRDPEATIHYLLAAGVLSLIGSGGDGSILQSVLGDIALDGVGDGIGLADLDLRSAAVLQRSASARPEVDRPRCTMPELKLPDSLRHHGVEGQVAVRYDVAADGACRFEVP